MSKRKEIIRILSEYLPGLSSAKNSKSTSPELTDDGSAPAAYGAEVYRRIGVEPIINCRGTFTIIGGSTKRPEVRKAMEAASHNYIQYDELAEGIGRRLAELTGAEWGIVSAGCAAAMKHATTACVAGGNPEKLIRIPDLTGFEKTEVIIPRHSHNAYDHAVRNVGVDMITVESLEELKLALSSRTAMIYLLAGQDRDGPLGLKSVTEIAKIHEVPVLVDAAAEDLTLPNAHLSDGATMVCYSGGKALRGPQSAGLLLGPKDLLTAAWQAGSPHHGPGRDNKIGREEMMGMLAAVETWLKIDHEAEWETWLSWLDHIDKRVSKIEGINTRVIEPTLPGMKHPGETAPISNHSPLLEIYWDPDKILLNGEELAETLGRTRPRIAVGSGDGPDPGTTSINVTAWRMKPGEDEIVADRISRLLSRKHSFRSNEMASPAATLTGRWKVDMEYLVSRSEHAFYIELQDDNWIKGAHKGHFSVRDLSGTIDGHTVKLQSTEQLPGRSVTHIFTGTLSQDGMSISGEVFLGEYLTAKFTAFRQSYSDNRKPIHVPDGPPLAT